MIDLAIDSATAVRKGEELDIAQLEAYLLQNLPGAKGQLVVEQFPSGYSNLTYLLRLGQQELVLRRPPFAAQAKGGHDMAREYRVLTTLKPIYPLVPQPLLYCDNVSVIGAPFYIMQRVQGVIIRGGGKPMDIAPDTYRKLSNAFVQALADMHALDVEATGLLQLGKPEGYVQRQVTGWTERYRKAQTDEQTHLEQLIPWLAQNIPAEAGVSLIHNDFKYDNLVLNPADLSQIIAVLDWEMCTVGDPLLDLGTSLGYWMEATDPEALRIFGPTTQAGNYTRQQVLDAYQQISGRVVTNPVFYYVFGLFKICVICQQIYYRYKQGHTQDKRFAMLNIVVAMLAQNGLTALEKQRVSWG